MSKFKIGDKVRCISAQAYQYIKLGDIYTVKEVIDDKYLILEEFHVDHDYNEDKFELVEVFKQPTSYREVSPDSTVKVKIGDYESEVCLGDLVHTTALLGVTNGYYGADLWKFLKNTLGEYSFEEDIDTIIEFREKQKRSLEYFFKPFYDKQEEKDLLLKDIEEQKTILKNQEEFLKELEDKYNSL